MQSKNLNSIHTLRAFSILYIVGFWHLFEYTDAFPGYKNAFIVVLTKIILGLFVIVSGYLIGRTFKKFINPMAFYKKRLVRIYPLYVLAVFLFYMYGLHDGATSIKALLLISPYCSSVPLTLWFIPVIFLFYFLAPILIKLSVKPVKFLLFSTIIFMTMVALLVTLHTIDVGILYYFPCFCAGIYCSENGLKNKFINISALLLFCLGLIVLFVEINSWTINQLKYIPIILSGSYLVLAISLINEKKFLKNQIISLISYSSFSIYLFHRPIYETLKLLYFPEKSHFQVFYLMTVCLASVVFISWGLQKSYDILCVVVNKKNAKNL